MDPATNKPFTLSRLHSPGIGATDLTAKGITPGDFEIDIVLNLAYAKSHENHHSRRHRPGRNYARAGVSSATGTRWWFSAASRAGRLARRGLGRETLGAWAAEMDGADAVINLAGRSVNCRYNAANRREIMESRVDSTRVVGRRSRGAPSAAVWLQASTATIYAHRYDAPNDEVTGILGGAEPRRAGYVALQHRRGQGVGKAPTRR